MTPKPFTFIATTNLREKEAEGKQSKRLTLRVHYSRAGGVLASNSFSMKPGFDASTMPYANAQFH